MVCPWGSNTDGFNVTNTLAFIGLRSGPRPPGAFSACSAARRRDRLRRHVLEYPREDGVDVAELIVEIERLVDFRRRQHRRQLAVSEEQRFEVLLLVEGAHRVALHPLVRLLA